MRNRERANGTYGNEKDLETSNEDRDCEIERKRDRERIRSRNEKEFVETGEVASATVVAKEKERN